MKIKSKL